MAMLELTTDVGAAAALTSPIWLPALHTTSEVAALLFPILGGLWLLLQIAVKIHQISRSTPPE